MLVLQALIAMSLGVVAPGAALIESDDTASNNKYSYLVSVRNMNRGHLCHGSFINQYWILTSANCIYGYRVMDLILKSYKSKVSDATFFLLRDIVIHEGYSEGDAYRKNNIGMVRVSTEIVFPIRHKPIALPDKDYADTDMSAIFVRQKIDTHNTLLFPLNEHLESVEMNLTSSKSGCRWDNNSTVGVITADVSRICGVRNDDVYMSPEEYGSPLIANNVLIGIASIIGNRENPATIFTSVWYYREWIRHEMRFDIQSTTTTSTTTTMPTTTTTSTTTTTPTITTTSTTERPKSFTLKFFFSTVMNGSINTQ